MGEPRAISDPSRIGVASESLISLAMLKLGDVSAPPVALATAAKCLGFGRRGGVD